MRAVHLVVRGFRNLADLELELPPEGAAFLGPNGQGKTSLLEALYYPVLCRSFRGASDAAVARWDGPGFRIGLAASINGGLAFEATFRRIDRAKRITVNGSDVPRLLDAVGHWLAVVFQPGDLHLVQGGASARRQYLDRVLSLTDAGYLRALLKFRGALAQRNAALRGGRTDLASAFDGALAESGAQVVGGRNAWVTAWRERFSEECALLGEPQAATWEYRGDTALADPGAWPEALRSAAGREARRGVTMVGPQRDDLAIDLGGRAIRDIGSTGQQRTAAVALKLCELAALGANRGTEPALLLDDVFAELDRDRQERLAARLGGPGVRQVFVTAPRRDELPPGFPLPTFEVLQGAVGREE
jgi:DNA replication and repair protein RecF